MGVTETESVPVVDSVVRAIHSLTADANYKLVSDVFSEAMFLKDQNRSLKTAKRELLEEYRNFRNELEEERQKLKDETDVIKAKVEEKERHIVELDNTNRQLAEAKEWLESQIREKDEALATLTEAKNGLDLDKTSLESEIADKNTQLTRLSDANLALAEEKAALDAQVQQKTKDLATLGDQRSAIEASLSEKTKELEALVKDKTTLTDEISALKTAAAKNNAELERLRLTEAALIEERATIDSKVSQQEKDVKDLQTLKSRLESDLAEAREFKALLETELAAANVKIEEQNKAAEASAKDIAKVKADAEERMMELIGLKDELNKVTTTAEEHKARRDFLETELTATAAKAEEMAAQVDTLEDRLSYLTKEVEASVTRIATLEGELTVMTTTANEAKSRVEFLETELGVVAGKADQLQDSLAVTSEELRLKKVRLAELDGYRAPLRTEPEDTYVQILDTIWTSIAGLVETQFRQDLDHSVLCDDSCWANLRQCEYLKNARHIPLPQSNSAAAKQMRVAAVLAVLSRSLHRYIFRPVYLADDRDGDECLVNMLRDIACDNPVRGEHIRATLLAMLPDKQRAAAAKRVSEVIREVSWSVQHLLSALQYEAFCTGLETACKLACVQWRRIQGAQMHIQPYFGPPYDSWDWQVLPLPAFEGSEEGVHLHGDSDDRPNVGALDDTDDIVVEIGRPVDDLPLSPTSGGGLTDHEDQNRPESSPRPVAGHADGHSEVAPDDIMLVVWPSMCALENGELESITQGLVISKDQVRAALDECRGRHRPTKRARTLSMPGRGASGYAGQACLSQGEGGGAADG